MENYFRNFTLVKEFLKKPDRAVYLVRAQYPFPDHPELFVVKQFFGIAEPAEVTIHRMLYENYGNILRVYDSWVLQNCYYMSIEYCEDGDLHCLLMALNGNPLSLQYILYIAYQISETVYYMHEKQICHRDIKPLNIYIKNNRTSYKLADFGEAKLVQRNGTDYHTITGTPYYMSPEQEGNYNNNLKLKVNPFRDDIWALGRTFIELSLGKLCPDTFKLKISDLHLYIDSNFKKFNYPPRLINLIKSMMTDINSFNLTISQVITEISSLYQQLFNQPEESSVSLVMQSEEHSLPESLPNTNVSNPPNTLVINSQVPMNPPSLALSGQRSDMLKSIEENDESGSESSGFSSSSDEIKVNEFKVPPPPNQVDNSKSSLGTGGSIIPPPVSRPAQGPPPPVLRPNAINQISPGLGGGSGVIEKPPAPSGVIVNGQMSGVSPFPPARQMPPFENKPEPVGSPRKGINSVVPSQNPQALPKMPVIMNGNGPASGPIVISNPLINGRIDLQQPQRPPIVAPPNYNQPPKPPNGGPVNFSPPNLPQMNISDVKPTQKISVVESEKAFEPSSPQISSPSPFKQPDSQGPNSPPNVIFRDLPSPEINPAPDLSNFKCAACNMRLNSKSIQLPCKDYYDNICLKDLYDGKLRDMKRKCDPLQCMKCNTAIDFAFFEKLEFLSQTSRKIAALQIYAHTMFNCPICKREIESCMLSRKFKSKTKKCKDCDYNFCTFCCVKGSHRWSCDLLKIFKEDPSKIEGYIGK